MRTSMLRGKHPHPDNRVGDKHTSGSCIAFLLTCELPGGIQLSTVGKRMLYIIVYSYIIPSTFEGTLWGGGWSGVMPQYESHLKFLIAWLGVWKSFLRFGCNYGLLDGEAKQFRACHFYTAIFSFTSLLKLALKSYWQSHSVLLMHWHQTSSKLYFCLTFTPLFHDTTRSKINKKTNSLFTNSHNKHRMARLFYFFFLEHLESETSPITSQWFNACF